MDILLIATILTITLLMAIAGYSDLKKRQLPGHGGNIVPLLILAVGIAYTVLTMQNYVDLWIPLINLGLASVILLLYKRMGMKAGDAKIMIALLAGIPYTLLGIMTIAMSTLPALPLLFSRIRPIPYITCLSIGYLTTITVLLALVFV